MGTSASPVWSPDKKQLAYAVDRARGSLYDGGDIAYIVRDTSTMQEREYPIAYSSNRNFFSRFVRWSPDGRSLLLPQWSQLPRQREFLRFDVATGKTETLFVAPWSNNLNAPFSANG